MIDSCVMLKNSNVYLWYNESNVTQDNRSLIIKMLKEYKSRASKVIQVRNFFLGVSVLKYKQSEMKIALISNEIIPNILQIAQNDLCEMIVKKYQTLDLDKTDSNRKLENSIQKFINKRNKQIKRSNEKMNQIQENLQSGINQTKENINILIDRGEQLGDLESKSSFLEQHAFHFEQQGKNLKNQILNEKKKIIIIFFFMIMLTFGFFYYLI